MRLISVQESCGTSRCLSSFHSLPEAVAVGAGGGPSGVLRARRCWLLPMELTCQFLFPVSANFWNMCVHGMRFESTALTASVLEMTSPCSKTVGRTDVGGLDFCEELRCQGCDIADTACC